eukprot:EG_transcript_13717
MKLVQDFSEKTEKVCREGTMLCTLEPTCLNKCRLWDSSSWGRFPMETYRFVSPVKDYLPKESHEGHAQIILPPEGQEILGVAIHLAATGDQGFTFRKVTAARPLAAAGIASILIEIPTYGSRRPKRQSKYYALDVSTYLCTSFACLWESQAWTQWAMQRWNVPCVIVGASYGGCMALGGFMMTMCCRDHAQPLPAVSLVSYLGSESPRALITGILQSEVDYESLTKDLPRVVQAHPQWQGLTAAEILFQRFDSISVRDFGVWPLLGAKVCLLSAAHDWIVVRREAQLSAERVAVLGPEVEARDIPGGHISSIALTKYFVVPRIIDAVHALRSAERLSGAK